MLSYGGFVQKFKPRTTASRRNTDLGEIKTIKRLRPRPFRPLVIVQDNATDYDINDILPQYRKGTDNFILNVDQADIEVREKDEDNISVIGQDDLRRDSNESIVPGGTGGGMEHGRMDSMASVASLAPTGLGNKDSLADTEKEKDDKKTKRESVYWNVGIKYDKYAPIDETPHLANLGREVAEMFEGENIGVRIPTPTWKAASAKLTKKKGGGIMGVIKAAMAAKQGAVSAAAAAAKKPEPKKVDTRPPKEQTKDYVKLHKGVRYQPMKWRPIVPADLLDPSQLIKSVTRDKPKYRQFRQKVKLTEQETLFCEEIAERTEKTDDPSQNIRIRYYKVLNSSSGRKEHHFVEEKIKVDDEIYKMRRMGVREYFRQDMMSPRRDSHINYALVPHDAINPEKLKTHTPEQRIRRPAAAPDSRGLSPYRKTDDKVPNIDNFKMLPTMSRRIQPKESSSRTSVTEPYSLVSHDQIDTRKLVRKPGQAKVVTPQTASFAKGWSAPYQLIPHDAQDTRDLMKKPNIDKLIQQKEASDRNSISLTFELVPHDAQDTREFKRMPDSLVRRLQTKETTYRHSISTTFELVADDADDIRDFMQKPDIIQRIQPKRLSDRGSITAPFQLVSHGAQDTRLLLRKPAIDMRLQPKLSSDRSSITAHYNLIGDHAVDTRTLTREPSIDRRTQAKEVSSNESFTEPYSLAAHDATDTRRLRKQSDVSRMTQPMKVMRKSSFTSDFTLASHDVTNVTTQLLRKPQTHSVIQPVEVNTKKSFTPPMRTVKDDAIDTRQILKMGEDIRYIQAQETTGADDLEVLEVVQPRVVPVDQLPKIKYGSDYLSRNIVKGWQSVRREFDHLHWTSDFQAQLVRRKRATVIPNYMKYFTTIKHTFMTECFCEDFKPHLFVPRRAVKNIIERLLHTVAKIGFTAEEEVEVYESPLLWQKKAIILPVFVFNHVPVHKELLTQQLNQEVAIYLVRKLLPVVTQHQHVLKTAIARTWQVEEEVDVAKIQVVDKRMAGFQASKPYNYKAAPLADRVIYENSNSNTIKKTVIDVAGVYKIVLPYTLPQGSDRLLREALDKVVKEANIKEPFYMRHIYASKNSPDQLIIIPKSMVDRARPRKVPQWQAPTRPAHYPRQSTISKDYNVENIADLSMPKADQRVIRSRQKVGPLYNSPSAQLFNELVSADQLNIVNTKIPGVKLKRQKNLPGLIPHTHFAEIHNYGSKRGRRRVRVPKARIKTVPLEFSEVGTQVSEVQKWFEAGITHNVDGVKGFDEQEELRIEDYLDQAPMSTYFSSAFEHTDHQRVLEVSRTKSRKVKIATKGKQLAETENWIIDELTGRTNEPFTKQRLKARKMQTRPRHLGMHWKNQVENYTDKYIYDPITHQPEDKFNVYQNGVQMFTEYHTGNVPEPAINSFPPPKARAARRRNIRRSYAARHKRLIKEEYANHKSEKLRPIDLLALRPKTYKYQVLSQIPSQAPHTEIDEFGLHKHVYIDEAPVRNATSYEHRESCNKATDVTELTGLGRGDNKALEKATLDSPYIDIYESARYTTNKTVTVATETTFNDKPEKVILDLVPVDKSTQHQENDFTTNLYNEFMGTGLVGDVPTVPVHKRIKAAKIIKASQQTGVDEWTPVNKSVDTNEPFSPMAIKSRQYKGPVNRAADKYSRMVEEYGSEYPCDRSFRSPDIENYFYEGGLQIPQRYEMEPEEWTGIAHSYDLQTKKIGYKKGKPVRRRAVQQTSRIREEFVDAYVADELVSYRPVVTHDLEKKKELMQHPQTQEIVPFDQIGPSLVSTSQDKPHEYEHSFGGYIRTDDVEYVANEEPDNLRIAPVNLIDDTNSPDIYRPGRPYYPEHYPDASTAIQMDHYAVPDTKTAKVVNRVEPQGEEIYGGWFDTTTNHWIIETTDGNMAIPASDIRLIRDRRVSRALSQHIKRTIYEKRRRLPKKPTLAAVKLDSRSPNRYFDYMFTSPDRMMTTPHEHAPHTQKTAIGQTKGKVFIEELRSSADGSQWGVTGIPNQDRIKKINRLRLMPKRYIEKPQNTADKIVKVDPQYTGPGVTKQRRYQPKVHHYHVTPSDTAIMQHSEDVYKARRLPPAELNKQLVKAQRFFDHPYSIPHERDFTKQELAVREPKAVRRFRPRHGRTMMHESAALVKQTVPIDHTDKPKHDDLNKYERRPSAYMDHLSQAGVRRLQIPEQQLDPYFIPKELVSTVYPKKVNLIATAHREGQMSDDVTSDNRSSASSSDQPVNSRLTGRRGTVRYHPATPASKRTTYQYETSY